jgi:hypothetical protein
MRYALIELSFKVHREFEVERLGHGTPIKYGFNIVNNLFNMNSLA